MNMEENSNFYLMFGRLEGKVDALLTAQASVDKRISDMDTRLTNLETAKHQGTGMVKAVHLGWAVLVAVVAFVTGPIKGLLL